MGCKCSSLNAPGTETPLSHSILKLDENNPYVEIIEVKKNKTFIAKKTNTFDEEKNVAETVPVNEIQMDDLTKSDTDTKKNKKEL